uniref:C2H2-type domain-containing protein n=1 Tax=viral metagenome TaxID=1070528 RepID=A0A6C0DKM9_9ZZZZ
MATFSNIFPANPAQKFYCIFCDYGTSRKSNYDEHIMTSKHKRQSNSNHCQSISSKIQQQIKYSCQFCSKEYNDKSGLWRHRKKCNSENNENIIKTDSNNSLEITPELIFSLIKQNNEFQQTIIEQNKTIVELSKNGTNNTINNNINSHNKTFNLQVFLNETCKDAMNISDFVESVKLQVTDLENVGKIGYIEGISNIIIKNLNALDIDKRPVHCADQKREVIYVKDENIWEKEDETNKKLRKAIRMIAHKNICMLKAFREKYPDCEEYDSKKNDQYNKIIYEAMGGKGDDDYDKNTKIIKKIAKVVGIEKG